MRAREAPRKAPSGGRVEKNTRRRLVRARAADARRQDALGGQDFIYSQRSGVEEELFKGNVLGVDADVATGEHRETSFRSFSNVSEEFHVPRRFIERVATHVAKNVLADKGSTRGCAPALILGVWGHKGCGKTFNVELACKKMGMTPIVTSAGELEDSTAGEPGAMLRRRYLTAARAMRETGRLSCLIINDIDAGIGKFKDDLGTVNNQITHGTLMNICDNPTQVSEGAVWRSDFKSTNARVPIIVTGNDFSRLYAPLTRDGRMDLWMWEPTRDELADVLYAMMSDDGLSKEDCVALVETFPNQPLDFFGAIRARVYDDAVRELILDVGLDDLGEALVGDERKRVWLEEVHVTLDALVTCGREIVCEQENVNSIQLAREYMRWQEPEDLASARAAEAARREKEPLPYEPDATAVELRERAKSMMLAASEERARNAEPAETIEEASEEESPESFPVAPRKHRRGTALDPSRIYGVRHSSRQGFQSRDAQGRRLHARRRAHRWSLRRRGHPRHRQHDHHHHRRRAIRRRLRPNRRLPRRRGVRRLSRRRPPRARRRLRRRRRGRRRPSVLPKALHTGRKETASIRRLRKRKRGDVLDRVQLTLASRRLRRSL